MAAIKLSAPPRNRKIINDVPLTVDDALMGLALSNRGLVLLEGQRVVMRRDHLKMHGKVKLISGGGGGHEPAHASYVGPGMLTAAICGDIFTAPPSNTILRAIRELGTGHEEGILLIVKNYTGDRLNFGLAMERARNENIRVKMLVVGEDCSLPNPSIAQGRRGLAGVVLIHKMAGAMAEEGRKLDDIFSACRSATMTDMATIGFGLRSATVPGSMSCNKIGEDELDLGLGIHNEPGVHKIPMGTAAEIAHSLLEHMWNPRSKSAIVLEPKCSIAVLINNLGGSSKLEEQIFAMETLKQFSLQGFVVERSYCGTFLSSLDMSGFSITVFKLTNPDIVKYLDAPTSAPGWPRVLCAGCVGMKTATVVDLPVCELGRCVHAEDDAERHLNMKVGPKLADRPAQALIQVVQLTAQAVMGIEKQLNMQDEEAGDGDCGTTMKRGAEGLLHAVKSGEMNPWRPFAILEHISTVAENSMGGTSGALYSIFFAAAAKPFSKMDEKASVDAKAWLISLHEGIEGIKRYGLAKRGDRTMLEPLVAAEVAIRESLEREPDNDKAAMTRGAEAAEDAAKKTIGMVPKIGRASYSSNKTLKLPDPGAQCVAVWMRAMCEGIKLVL